MKRKIFISINIPERDKRRLVKAVEKWQSLPVKWVKEPNMHITLFFLGYIDTEAIAEICQKVREVAENFESFDVDFDQIELGPKKDDPKLVWLTGESNEKLRQLHEEIEKALDIFTSSKKSFRPHVTLGRIRKHKWQELTPKPELSEKYPLNIEVETVDVMASDFGEEDGEYALIESCSLK